MEENEDISEEEKGRRIISQVRELSASNVLRVGTCIIAGFASIFSPDERPGILLDIYTTISNVAKEEWETNQKLKEKLDE